MSAMNSAGRPRPSVPRAMPSQSRAWAPEIVKTALVRPAELRYANGQFTLH